MALKSELLTVLDNTEEPLAKRLRIANNIFNSNDLPVFNKESVLFNWFSKNCLKGEGTEIWDSLYNCIKSSHMKELKLNEIKHDILNNIVKTIIKGLKKNVDYDNKSKIINCALVVINTDIFLKYFEYNLKQYCKIISEIFMNTEDIAIIKSVIAGHFVFHKKIVAKNDYATYFLSYTFNSLITTLHKFPNHDLFIESTKLIQHVIFLTYATDFTNILLFDENNDELCSNYILNKLNDLYKLETKFAKLGFKLIFLSYLLATKNDSLLLYKFLILLVNNFGFNIKKLLNVNLPKNDETDLEKSLEIIAELFEIIQSKNIEINETVNDLTFSNFIKYFVLSVIRLQKTPNLSSLQILKCIISIDPLSIDNSISEILRFIVLFKKDEYSQVFYSELFICIIEMYLKLHRIPTFTSNLIETIKNVLFSTCKSHKPKMSFFGKIIEKDLEYVDCVREIFPENVVTYFQKCISLLTNKTTVKIMSILLDFQKEFAEDLQSYTEDSKKILYIEIVNDLIYQFLSAVRIFEHTTAHIIVKKFICNMNILRENLKNFGTSLLKMQHIHNLMFSFLNTCYIWGEIAILLMCYAPPTDMDTNFKSSSNDLRYLHNYLSVEQWRLISQRIKNFGEQPCKLSLEKLDIQKLKAMMVFENAVDDSVELQTITNFSSNLELNWKIIFSERFVAPTLIPRIENSQLILLAEFIINDILETKSFEIFNQRSIIDLRDLMTSIFYVCMSKISKLFKGKRKSNDFPSKPTCIKILKNIDADSFVRTEIVDLQKIAAQLSTTNNFDYLKIDAEKFLIYMEIIKNVPVCFFSHDVQVTFFLFLLSICSDLKQSREDNLECLEKCELYLHALLENSSSPNMFNYIQTEVLIKLIVESVNNYGKILHHVINISLKQNDTSLISGINLLDTKIAEEKYFKVATITYKLINHLSEKNNFKKYKIKLNKMMMKIVTNNEAIDDNKLEAYYLVLKYFLEDKDEENLNKLNLLLQPYINYIFKNTNENNSKQCHDLVKLLVSFDIPNLPTNFVSNVWNVYKEIKYDENIIKVICLLFQQINNYDFSMMIKDLLKISNKSLDNENLDMFLNQLIIWKKLMNFTFPDEKYNHIQKRIENLLQNIIVYLHSKNTNQKFNEEIVKFQINIIENAKLINSSDIIDIYFETIQILISKEHNFDQFIVAFETNFPIMEHLLLNQKELLCDRLPTYLLCFRLFLRNLCLKSNSDVSISAADLKKLSDCAFRVEKLVKTLCLMKKDLTRIAPYLIADILKEHERITFYPEVKNHLNNCVIALLELCDSHAISFLLRVLSLASSELFKNLNKSFEKYHRFRGKV